ncbi:hypothetical protein M409DRAFT_55626 [Zasmidium cellare ATCC 36951]|uniref:SnoaL-like domain-containing protein n=1 Tax=Zasmidium cellare ATCC 36951 TaxID=1080233 RepID=A0A6A6CFA9_ZASCE|nr:uncharacterized protein M409DRAFT_55626 [Zasmidium cellare ATCC 36951]KAF2165751.1 hypothetical protein M409DRAFT_55626 [Zasmidium cellare ATCC 36951]
MAISKPCIEDVKVQKPSPLPETATEEEIISHIESIVASIANAVNERQFDPNTAPWTSVASEFSMPAIGFRGEAKSREDYVDGFKNLALPYPNFRIEPLKMESYVLLAVGYAEVYLTAQSSGGRTLPMGIKRKGIGRHEFRRVDGAWMNVNETSFLGIGDGVAVFEM